MFRITGGKGFHITFDNGWTVSVQFGPGNYCDNYDENDHEKAGAQGSTTAECAVWGPDKKIVSAPDWDEETVSNRTRANDVLELMKWAASQP